MAPEELQSEAVPVGVEVGLLSGKSVSLKAAPDETVATLKRRAQDALAVGRQGRLLHSSGEILEGSESIKKARLRDGDSLTLQVNRMVLASNMRAFAAIRADGSVVTWGDAAILADGSVVTWGLAECGGDCSFVKSS